MGDDGDTCSVPRASTFAVRSYERKLQSSCSPNKGLSCSPTRFVVMSNLPRHSRRQPALACDGSDGAAGALLDEEAGGGGNVLVDASEATRELVASAKG